MKKKILIVSIFAAFLILMMPNISAIEYREVVEKQKTILECINNKILDDSIWEKIVEFIRQILEIFFTVVFVIIGIILIPFMLLALIPILVEQAIYLLIAGIFYLIYLFLCWVFQIDPEPLP